MLYLAVSVGLAAVPSRAGAQVWRTETVDAGSGHEVGEFSSCAVDHDGNLHVAYWDATANAPRGSLLYAYRGKQDSHWSRMVVDMDGTYVSLAVDGSDRPHIAYESKRETGLHYAYWDGAKWRREIIDPGRTNYYTSIQVDSNGHPKISYYLYHLPNLEYSLHLKYAFFDGKQWYIQTVDPRMHTGKVNSLALDASGNPHIAYSYLGVTGDLLYARQAGSDWTLGAADLSRTENTHLSLGNSIAVDSAGHPHIAYFDNTKNTVKYAYWNGSRWITEVVDHLVGLEELDHVSLKMDSLNRAHIAYYDAGMGALKYAVREPTGWQREIVDHQGNVGLRPTLVLGSSGEPYICYQDLSDHSVRLASRQSRATIATVKK